LIQKTIVSQIIKNAELYPEKLAITSELKSAEEDISYKELSKKIKKASKFLIDNDVSKGETVILSGSNSIAFVIGYFATHLIGAIAIPIDVQLKKSQIQFISEKCKVKIAFLSNNTLVEGIPKIFPLNKLLKNDSSELNREISIKPNDSADIVFTSGTTGKPKGVILSHENILESSKNINNFIKNTSEDIEVLPTPFSHSFGLARLRCNFLAGASVALASGFLFPGRIYQQLQATSATAISFVPAGAAVLLKFGENKLAKFKNQLKYIEIGSAPMHITHKKKLMELLPNTKICMHYGSTESSRSCFIDFHQDKDNLDSVGKVTPGVYLKIQNENGEECKINESGEIFTKGKSVSKGYITSKMSIKNDWLSTGDIGYKNEKDYIFLNGRKNDLINIGGKKVSPLEIENMINLIPSISECACIGISDPNGISGNIISALLVLKKSKENIYNKISDIDLTAYLRENLESYKIPSEFNWIDKIPKTSLGKIKRNIIK
tara:strand:- start:1949 stop:3427 length:1479 start_codon:yes stop_codon:yes gene_type:complete